MDTISGERIIENIKNRGKRDRRRRSNARSSPIEIKR